jgi:glutathione S-transferase
MSKILLYHFPISHYSEKIRWALDYKGIAHTKKTLLPGMHIKKMVKYTGQSSVPVLKYKNRYFHDSAKILDFLEAQFPEKPLTPLDSDQAEDVNRWENFADTQIGPYVRTLMYHHLLEQPDIVIGFFSQAGPFYGRILLTLMYPKLVLKMRKYMNINQETANNAKVQLDQSITKLTLALAGREFLVGNTFTRADLAVASLLAPLLMPTGYGLDKPELPVELQTLLDTYEPRLLWVNKLYSEYR